jgi:dihydroflavonol-4-reductase
MDMVAVDVRDVARMHVAAIDLEATKGERFAAASGTHRLLELGRMLKAWDAALKTPGREAPVWLLPDHGAVFQGRERGSRECWSHPRRFGCQGRKTFGFKFIPVKDALVASAKAVQTTN